MKHFFLLAFVALLPLFVSSCEDESDEREKMVYYRISQTVRVDGDDDAAHAIVKSFQDILNGIQGESVERHDEELTTAFQANYEVQKAAHPTATGVVSLLLYRYKDDTMLKVWTYDFEK